MCSFPYQKHDAYLSVSCECCAASGLSLMWTCLCSNKHIISSCRRARQRRLSTHTSLSASSLERGLTDRCIDSAFSSPQEYQIDIIFAQTWVDTRLRYNSSSTSMPTLTLNRYTEDTLKRCVTFAACSIHAYVFNGL